MAQFDQLYVLARGGVCIYSGRPDRIQQCLAIVEVEKEKENDLDSSEDSKLAIEKLIKHCCAGTEDPVVQRLVELQSDHLNHSSAMEPGTYQSQDGVERNRKRFSLYSSYVLSLRYLAYLRGGAWKEYLFFLFNYLFYGYTLIWFYDVKMFNFVGCIDLAESDLNSSCTKSGHNMNETNLLLNNFKYNYFVMIFYLLFILVQSALTFRREMVYFECEHRNGKHHIILP